MRTLATWLLPRYAAGLLPRPLARFVRRALDRDIDLRAAYDALRRAERAAAGDPALTDGQLAAILGDVLDTVDAAAAADAPAQAESWGLAALGAAACAAFVVVGAPAAPASDPEPGLGTLQGRGGAATEPVGIRVRCVDERRVVGEATAGARQRGAVLECNDGGLLAFSTTNLASTTRYAFVVGIDDRGERVWVGPFGPDAPAAAVPAGTIDAVLDRLAPMDRLPDHTTLHVLIADEPFSGTDVERRLAAAARAAVPLGRLDRLPLDVPVQSHLMLYRLP